MPWFIKIMLVVFCTTDVFLEMPNFPYLSVTMRCRLMINTNFNIGKFSNVSKCPINVISQCCFVYIFYFILVGYRKKELVFLSVSLYFFLSLSVSLSFNLSLPLSPLSETNSIDPEYRAFSFIRESVSLEISCYFYHLSI